MNEVRNERNELSASANADLAKRLKRSEDARRALANAIDFLQRRERALEQWIESEGDRNDTCTYNILKKVCAGCKCHRQNYQAEALSDSAGSRLEALESGVSSFKNMCDNACNYRRGENPRYCDAYRSRNMICSDCPREWSAELQAHIDSANATGSGQMQMR